MYYTCINCESRVSPGEARVRSISFHQVAYCRPCWDELHSIVPAQRSPEEILDPAQA